MGDEGVDGEPFLDGLVEGFDPIDWVFAFADWAFGSCVVSLDNVIG